MLRSDQYTSQQYAFNAVAAANSSAPTPSNPSRAFLLIQNNGLNPLLVNFGKPNDGRTDFVIAAGTFKEWAIKVPVDSVNIQSTLGTTGIIIEGTRPNAGR